MTWTLVKVINTEIFYDLDWNLTFVESNDLLNIWIEEDSPGPRVSGDSDDQDIHDADQRSQVEDSDQGDTNINCPLIPSQSHTKHIFMGWEIHLSDNIIPRRSEEKYSPIDFCEYFHRDHKYWAVIGWGSPVNHFQLSHFLIGGKVGKTG